MKRKMPRKYQKRNHKKYFNKRKNNVNWWVKYSSSSTPRVWSYTKDFIGPQTFPKIIDDTFQTVAENIGSGLSGLGLQSLSEMIIDDEF